MNSPLQPLIDQAVADLDTITRGGALCALTRDGRSAPTAKFVEGRWAALTELQRSRERGEPDDVVLSRWQTSLGRHLAHQAQSDWIAYDTGGVDALSEVLARPVPNEARAD